MCEFIVKGKREDTGEWIEGYLSISPFTNWPFIHQVNGNGIGYKVIPETVGQFTGYTDKNGKKIFEGDIVRHGFGKYTSYTHVVEWVDESCGFEPFSDSRENCGHCGGGVNPDIEDCYVIGNIYDNPELLEG